MLSSLYHCITVSLYLSISISLSLYLSIPVSLSVFLYPWISVSLYPCIRSSLYLCIHVSLYICTPVSLYHRKIVPFLIIIVGLTLGLLMTRIKKKLDKAGFYSEIYSLRGFAYHNRYWFRWLRGALAGEEGQEVRS